MAVRGVRRRLAAASKSRYSESAVLIVTAQPSNMTRPTGTRAGSDVRIAGVNMAFSCRLEYV